MRTLIKRALMFAYCRGWLSMPATETLFRRLRLAAC